MLSTLFVFEIIKMAALLATQQSQTTGVKGFRCLLSPVWW